MNYIIFITVSAAYLGIGGNQPTYAQFGSEPQGTKGILYNEPTQLNGFEPMDTSGVISPNLANCVISSGTLLHLASSLQQYKALAKVSCWATDLYLIFYASNSFQPLACPPMSPRVSLQRLGIASGQVQGIKSRALSLGGRRCNPATPGNGPGQPMSNRSNQQSWRLNPSIQSLLAQIWLTLMPDQILLPL
ncbi:hypothetical protein DSO57_1004811 [Entomophthora muscae]|uniref:Uncharacterized protein n=1 Tax=Entomophthora muscae TaxID=34485 RepID=A0ACC2RN45_9FUNG|nr:hypothetical protein DSO57_1004811 [Entomophthora muscae]